MRQKFEKSKLKEKLEKFEKIKERISIEKFDREEKLRRDKERKRAWRKDEENEENKHLVRELERVERREKKKMLEDRWSMMKWISSFIEDNEDKWMREMRGKEEKFIYLAGWEELQ